MSTPYFLPYQERWITDDSPMKLYEKTRRAGITYATSYRSVQKCLRETRKNFTQWVSSRDAITAKEFITQYVAMWAKAANAVCQGLNGDNIQVIDEDKKITAMVVEFANGNRIVSLSSNPLAFAGKGGDVLLDEMDLHENQDILLAMAQPCTIWGGQLEIVSAYDPDGSENTEFAQLCRDTKYNGNPMGWSFHRTSITDAVEEGFVEKVNEIKRATGKATQSRDEFLEQIRRSCKTQSAYDTQYLAIPNKASGERAVRYADLEHAKQDVHVDIFNFVGDAQAGDEIDPVTDSMVITDAWMPYLTSERYVLGYDVARRKDLGVVWVDEVQGDHFQLRLLILFRNCKFETQKQVIHAMMSTGKVRGAGDSTGMGETNCEWLATRHIERFIGVNFASKKQELGTGLTAVFEQNQQTLPRDPAYIGADIAAIRKVTRENGKLIYSETANELENDSHCDMAWACALAKYAALNLFYQGEVYAEPVRCVIVGASDAMRMHALDDEIFQSDANEMKAVF